MQTRADLKPLKTLYLSTASDHEKNQCLDHSDNDISSYEKKLKTALHEMINQDGERYSQMEKIHNELFFYFIQHAIDLVALRQK